MYKYIFKVDTIDHAFLDKYYGKMSTVKNMKTLFGSTNKYDQFIDECKIDFRDIKREEKLIAIKDLFFELKYTLDEIKTGNKKMSREFVEQFLAKTNWLNKYDQLFNLCKKEILTVKSLLGSLNTILDNYGLMIDVNKKNTKENGIDISIYNYGMLIDDNMKYLL